MGRVIDISRQSNSNDTGVQRLYLFDTASGEVTHCKVDFPKILLMVSNIKASLTSDTSRLSLSKDLQLAFSNYLSWNKDIDSFNQLIFIASYYVLSSQSYINFRKHYPDVDTSFSFFLAVHPQMQGKTTNECIHTFGTLISGDILDDIFKKLLTRSESVAKIGKLNIIRNNLDSIHIDSPFNCIS
jgi:hypothetical protein